ncbi:hypothetical protein Tco_0709321 [Tanacetum coccineum]
MADHSHKWYDEATTRERINGSSDDTDIKKLDENIHVFQVSCKTCEGMHLTEECTLRKEDKAIEQNKFSQQGMGIRGLLDSLSCGESCDNHDLSRFDNQSIERDRLIGIEFVLNFVEFISFTFSDKEMIFVIEAGSR